MERATRMRRALRRLLVIIASAATMLMTAVVLPAHATTPGKNGRIVFSLDKGSGFQLYSIKRNGTDLPRLTSVSGAAISADWSSNGRRIVFADDINEGTASNIAIMRADGSHFRDLTHAGFREEPAFIPRGHQIVYGCDCGKTNGLFVMRDDGSNRRRLTKNPYLYAVDTSPDVSPDGTIVTFVRVEKADALQALFAVDLNGSNLRMLVPFSFEVGTKQDWAPGGDHIVFTVDADSPGGLFPNVATIRPDGTDMQMLTHVHRAGVRALAGSYSPNGRWIAFKIVNDNTGTYKLMKMHPDGSDRTLIASLPFSPPFQIDWGPQPG